MIRIYRNDVALSVDNLWIFYSNNWCDEIYEFLDYVGMTDLVVEKIGMVKKKINELESELKLEKESMQKLLDISMIN